jgi:hypothetical protein
MIHFFRLNPRSGRDYSCPVTAQGFHNLRQIRDSTNKGMGRGRDLFPIFVCGPAVHGLIPSANSWR